MTLIFYNSKNFIHRDDQDENGFILPAVISDEKQEWYNNGNCHRDEQDENGFTLPAVIYKDGTKKWYKNGKLHRVYGPAIENKDSQFWYFNGKLHRVGGPAIIKKDCEEWWVNGKRHREEYKDGKLLPAIIWKNGDMEWYLFDKLHNTTGPAYIKGDVIIWYFDGLKHNSNGPAYVDGNRKEFWIYGEKV